MQKKKWQNPELIVLVRGKPEEAVLTTCKGELSGTPDDLAGNCEIGSVMCTTCNAPSAS